MKKINFCADWQYNGRTVTLPHDAMLEQGRAPDAPGGSAVGYYKGSTAVYKKTFARPDAENVLFLFEGVYRKAEVVINGQKAGGCAYGYTQFLVDAAPCLQDGENEIVVTADNSQLPNSRWYSGTGIYRPVWMLTSGKAHILPNTLRVTTVGIDPPQVNVEVKTESGEANIALYDGDTLLAEGAPGTFTLPGAALWDDSMPKLYRCRVTLTADGKTADEEETAFGIRQIGKDSRGFLVNGKPTLLRGGCIHHDNGILGACAYKEAEWRKVRMLKEAGFNAIRSAHNPCSTALLDACDYYGIYVLDESWDMWYQRKNLYDYGLDFEANWQSDLRAMVEKDYNHPSVLFYSIGNEVSEPAAERGLILAENMTALLHELDSTRYVTGGFNLMLLGRAAKGHVQFSEQAPDTKPVNSSMMFNKMASMIGTGMNKSSGSEEIDKLITPLMDKLDAAGYNYASGRYDKDAVLHPERLIIGTETFPQDIFKNWEMVKQYPMLAGDFMWTAWDYLGEAGIGAWAYTPDGRSFNKPYPWLLGDVGALDLLGDPNGEVYLAQAAWGLLDKPQICVQPVNHPGVQPAKQTWRGTNALPTWSWKGCEKNSAVVEVYTTAAKVELRLNGKRVSLGKKAVKDGKATFKMRYFPGSLEAIAYDTDGQECGRSTLASAGPAKPTLRFEKDCAAPGEVLFVPISMADAHGIVEANDDRTLKVTVENGTLLGFGSANPRTEDDFLAGQAATYYGRALAAVRAADQGTVTVTVTDGMNSSSAAIQVKQGRADA